MLRTIISSAWMLSAALLITSVLLHSPKGDGMGGLFSTGSSMFTSARSAEATLNRVTWMNVQIIHFVDIWLKRLCLKICNTARCNKELVSQDFSTVKRRKF